MGPPGVLGQIDVDGLRAGTSSGIIMVVGPSMDKVTKASRRSLAQAGVLVISTDELADIAEVEAGADVSLDALERLATAV